MRKRILLVSLLVTVLAILIYSLVSTQLYYNLMVEQEQGRLSVYVNMFSPGEYTLDNDGAKALSQRLEGTRVTFMDG